MVNVLYGLLPEKLSAKKVERFIHLHASTMGYQDKIPMSPVAKFWCRKVRKKKDEYEIGWTAPMVIPAGFEEVEVASSH